MKTFLLVILMCFAVQLAIAQSSGPGITIYEHENYNGKSVVVKSDWSAPAGWNDIISSIRIPQGYKIQVYEHGGFQGRSLTLTNDWTVGMNLGFNDLISSIRIIDYPRSMPVVTDMVCCGQTLGRIESPNKMYFLVFQQTDKNLVVYTRDNRPLWASNTGGLTATSCVMQQDGNLVIYNGSAPIWASNTYGNNGAKLVMQDDGNLVMYRSDNNMPFWATNTAQAQQVPVVVAAPVEAVAAGPCAIPDNQFNTAVAAIEAQSFRDQRMAVAKQSIKNKCASLDQIRTMAKLFDFEDQTLEFLKYAYDFNNEKSEYYTLSDIFAFNSNTESFMKFLESK